MTTTAAPATGRQWGRTAELRARRDYLGLTAEGMAAELGMSRRSYQRMERGDEPIPVGVWADVQLVDERMDTAVHNLVTAALAQDQDNPEPYLEVLVYEDDSEWDRMVFARAKHGRAWLVPKFDDDYLAVKEMEDENGDRVPEQDGGGEPHRGETRDDRPLQAAARGRRDR